MLCYNKIIVWVIWVSQIVIESCNKACFSNELAKILYDKVEQVLRIETIKQEIANQRKKEHQIYR